MFLLDRSVSNFKNYSDTIAELRSNGCNCPTMDDCFLVFKNIQKLMMVRKLAGEDPYKIPVLDLLRLLKGENARLDITGIGFEFSGWYMEIYALQAANILMIHQHGKLLTVSNLLSGHFNAIEKTDDEIRSSFKDFMLEWQVASKIKEEITNRVFRFSLVPLLVSASFLERD